MKTAPLFCSLCLLLCLTGRAQSIYQSLPVDSTSGKITYEGVIQVPGASQDALYTRAREWAALAFRSTKDVLQMDDRPAGTLIARGYVLQPGYMATAQIWRTIKLYTKEGRYRYEITDFTLVGPAALYVSHGLMEKELEVASGHGRIKTPKGHYKYLLDCISSTTEPEVAALQQAMSKPASKDF